MAIGKFSNKNWLAKIGASLGLPELGLSELLMGDTRASKLAKSNASTRVAGTNGGYLSAAGATFNPNSKGGQSYYNQGMVNLATPLNMANAEGAAVTQALKDKKAKEEEMLRLANTTTGTDGTGGTVADTFPPTPYDDGTGSRLYYTAEELAQAVQRKISKIYNDSVALIEQQFKQGFISIDERDDAIKKTRKDLIAKKENDLQSVSGYFNSIAPDAIQSGRGKLETKAIEDYTNQNKTLGSEFDQSLYGPDGRLRQDLTPEQLAPYMTELSDTGNLARAYAGNYTNRQNAINAAAQNQSDATTENAYNYSNNLPAGSNYANYLNGNILNKAVSTTGTSGPANVKKVDKYGNPIDEWYNR